MGLFNFTKKNGQSTADVKTPEAKLTATLPVESAEVIPVDRPEVRKSKLPEVLTRKDRRDDINSFFNINLYNIFKYNPESEGKQEYEKGQWAEVFTMKLSNPELDCFNKVHIIQYENGNYDLVFKSMLCEVKNDLKEFIGFCADRFGADFMGKKELTDSDSNDFRLGVFSRLWIDRVRIDNVYLYVNMTIYNISPEKK